MKNYEGRSSYSYKATFAVVKRKPEKIQACTGFEPLTSLIPVQCSANYMYRKLTCQLGAGC